MTVFGGTGFIGSHVVEQLLALGAFPVVPSRNPEPGFLRHLGGAVRVLQCDLESTSDARRAVHGSTAVLHLAASVGGLAFNAKHSASIFHVNMLLFLNAIRAAQESGVERFLVTSSACVYPRHCSIPTPESEGFADRPEPTNEGYGWAKRMEEFLGAAYASEFAMPVAIARPYNAYGPRDNFSPDKSHVLPALIHRAMTTEGDSFAVWGDGSHSRSFLYADDFARGLLEVAARYAEGDPVNLGADEEVTIHQVATQIADRVSAIRGRRIAARFDPSGLTGQPRRKCDTRKAIATLGFESRVPFSTGLEQTIDWYRSLG